MKCQSMILAQKALGAGRREGSWAAKAASDLIIPYLGYHIFFSLLRKVSPQPFHWGETH